MILDRHKFRALPAAVLAMLMSPAPAYAQAFDGAIGGVRSLYVSLGNLLKIALGIGAMVVLVMIVLRIMRGDKESAAKLGWWLLGLAFGFTMITFLQNMANVI